MYCQRHSNNLKLKQSNGFCGRTREGIFKNNMVMIHNSNDICFFSTFSVFPHMKRKEND
jgi:hypothetical protein